MQVGSRHNVYDLDNSSDFVFSQGNFHQTRAFQRLNSYSQICASRHKTRHLLRRAPCVWATLRHNFGVRVNSQTFVPLCLIKISPIFEVMAKYLSPKRTNYARLDLNRQWESPTKEKSPPIYFLKGMMTNLVNEGKHIFCYTDLHGHS